MSIFSKKAAAEPRAKAGSIQFDPPADDVVREGDEVIVEEVVVDGADRPLDEDHVPVEADLAPAPAKTSRFGRSSEPKAVKVKLEKAPKAAKAERAPKAEKVKRSKTKAAPEEEISLPITVVIDFYMGLVKEREAEQIARAAIEKNFDAPNASYLYTQKWRGGIAVEMQEGGGKAYLPEVLAKLDEDPHALIAVPMSNRFAQIRLDPDTKSLETLLLVANQLPPDDAFIALPTRTMRPFDRRGSKVFIAGCALMVASLMAMLFSIGAFFIDTHAWAIPYTAQTPVKDLPMAQSSKIESALKAGDCVFKMEFAGGQWNVTTGYGNGDVCSNQRTAPVVVEQAAPSVDATGAPLPQPGVGLLPSAGIPSAGVPGALPPVTTGAGLPGAPAGSALPPGATPPVTR
jgi:hypothetical protein